MGFFLRSYTYKLILITLFTGIIKQHTQESHFTIVATLNYHNKELNFEWNIWLPLQIVEL